MGASRRARGRRYASLLVTSVACALVLGAIDAAVSARSKDGGGTAGGSSLPTTANDFIQQGTPVLGAGLSTPLDEFLPASQCALCHASYGNQDPMEIAEPYTPWVASMMGQSGRDPLFYAGLTIANQDAAGAGEYCIRCHLPVGWLNGHATPTDGSALDDLDRQGVQCNFCHRLVDPSFEAGISPSVDEAILDDLSSIGLLPPESNNARYVLDPIDSRRGPFDDLNDPGDNIHPLDPKTLVQPEIIYSPFHSSAEFCWNCHGVSNVLIQKNGDGTYGLDPVDTPHGTGNQTDMFPLHRTYSEWKNSYYSTIGVQHDGRFGGNHHLNDQLPDSGIMKECQDCHMPDQVGYGCFITADPYILRQDAPQHSFVGSNTWVLNAIRTVDFDGNSEPDFPDSASGLNDDNVNAAIFRNLEFLAKASDLQVTRQGSTLKARVINRTGHKLPTGFPDGRRIWVNVQFYDCTETLFLEHGAYDFLTATLTTADTKVYEMFLGVDGADYAASVGHPEGHTFHFMLANKILKDNRIPPAGFSNTIAQQNQTAPVGATYSNGQHWDDTTFPIPENATRIVTSVYYQLTSKEFIEHLRDDNTTDNRGQVVYDLWLEHGMGAPVLMDSNELIIYRPEDIDQSGDVNVDDLLALISAWGACSGQCPADVNGDGFVDVDDLLAVISGWGPC